MTLYSLTSFVLDGPEVKKRDDTYRYVNAGFPHFYEFYFKLTSEKFNISNENFYDPLKKIYKNPGFKSFTSKYFKLLLESPNFKNDVTNLLESGKFLLNALLEYPKQFKKILSSVPTILIDQHKKKSKFLWTSYEFFFASYFFKKKVQI